MRSALGPSHKTRESRGIAALHHGGRARSALLRPAHPSGGHGLGRSQPRLVCQSVRFPAALPLLPFAPKEALPPGSCKVLRLYDSSYMLLLEELLSSPHQMMVHSAVEPSTKVDAATRLGGYEAGGFVFFLSTIIKVIDVKQTERGVLLRVQAEGRVAVKSLAQSQPYFRAVVVPVTDSVDLDRLQAPLWRDICASAERLRGLMRDVQNLSSKFKCPETANLQRAMYWVDNPHPLLFCSSSLLLNSRTAGGGVSAMGPLGSFDDLQPSKVLATHLLPDPDPPRLFTEGGSMGGMSGSDSDSEISVAAASGGGGGTESLRLSSAAGGGGEGGGLAAAAVLGGSSTLGGPIRVQPSLLDLERACRLSLAAIQPLPRCTEQEQEAVRKQQAAALETQDVLERLLLAQQVMAEARGLLSAKCALLSLSAAL